MGLKLILQVSTGNAMASRSQPRSHHTRYSEIGEVAP
jgi:hypothetical protein